MSMIERFENIVSGWFSSIRFESADIKYITAWILFGISLVISYFIFYGLQWGGTKVVKKIVNKKGSLFHKALLDKKFYKRLAYIPALILINVFINIFFTDGSRTENFLLTILSVVSVIAVVSIIFSLLEGVDFSYSHTDRYTKQGSIKGIIQAAKTIIYIIAAIFIISLVAGVKIEKLLATLGAASAILMLVFKDSILGLVGGIQLSLNKMVLPGDWIEMPSANADGNVIDITQITVKVQNWDNTITTIPTYDLISKPVKNWRGMSESGGRRIKRSIYIDMTSVQFCTDEMLQRFRQIEYISDYIDQKESEIDKYNEENKVDEKLEVNGRRQTNLGVFRAYLQRYLDNHPMLNHDFTLMVRQLQPADSGIPLEIYVFTNTTKWIDYENIQSDIFDHIISSIPYFDLRIFQNPSDYSLTALTAPNIASAETDTTSS